MPKLAKLLTSTVIAATLATVGSAADNSSAEAFAAARLANFGSGNIEGLLAQYADDATIISPMGVIDTAEDRHGMIAGIIGNNSLDRITTCAPEICPSNQRTPGMPIRLSSNKIIRCPTKLAPSGIPKRSR